MLDSRYHCKLCGGEINTKHGRPHTCKGSKAACWHCDAVHARAEPYCYIQPLAKKAVDDDDSEPVAKKAKRGEKKPVRYVIFDCESTQDRENDSTARRHNVNLIVAEVICENCLRDGLTVNDPDRYRELFLILL
jgi:hypothetical protein